MNKWLFLILVLMSSSIYGQGSPPPSPHPRDSIGVDTDGDGTIDGWMYSTENGIAHLKKGANITLTLLGDTVTIAGSASAGTADSMGVDTDGDGTIDAYLYSTVAGAFHIKKGSNITLTVLGDTLTIAGSAGASVLDERNNVANDTASWADDDNDTNFVAFDNDAGRVTWKTGQTGAGGAQALTIVADSLNVNNLAINDSLTFPQSVAPFPTGEGRFEWDTDNDILFVGDGVTSRVFHTSNKYSGDINVNTAAAVFIQDNAVQESDVDITNAGSAADILTQGAGDDFTWITPNAGTDITADLEEETHASEHQDVGADEIAVTAGMMNTGTGASSSTFWRGDNTWQVPAGGSAVWDERNNVNNDSVSFADDDNDTLAVFWDDDAGNVRLEVGKTGANVAQSLRIKVDTLDISGDVISDFAGTNLSVTAGVLNASGGGLSFFTEADDNDTSVFTATGPNTTVGFNDRLTMQGNNITGLSGILIDAPSGSAIEIVGDPSLTMFVHNTGGNNSEIILDVDGATGDPNIAFRAAATNWVMGADNTAADAFVLSRSTTLGTNNIFSVSTSDVIQFNSAYTFPTTDGSANQVLQTDGAGALTFQTVSGSGDNVKVDTGDGSVKVIDAGSPVVFQEGEAIQLDIDANDTITVAVEDATTTNKGAASFDATDFSVSSGAVTIDDDGHAHTSTSLSGIDTASTTRNQTQWVEASQDNVMEGIDNGTQTGITVTYQDGTNDMDFVVSVTGGSSAEIIDNSVTMQDDMATFTEAQLETQLSDVTAVFTNNVTGDVTVSGATSAITGNVIVEADLNATNAPTDNFVLTYNSAGSNFTWAVDAGGSSVWIHNGDSAILLDEADGDTLMIIYDNDLNAVTWKTGGDAGGTAQDILYDKMPYFGSVAAGTKFATIDDITGNVDIGVGDLKVTGSFRQTNMSRLLDVTYAHAPHAQNYMDSIYTVIKQSSSDTAWTKEMDSSYVVHPWVGYDPDGWFGVKANKWAMTHTPVGPTSGFTGENPHLLVSSNGSYFHRFTGGADSTEAAGDTVTNPIAFRDTYGMSFLSDPTGVPGNDGDTLWIIFRGIDGSPDTSFLLAFGTVDGKTFTDTDTILRFPSSVNNLLSPTVVTGDVYRMWTINTSTDPDSVWVWETIHRPDTGWVAVDSFKLDIDDAGGTPWHFDIKALGEVLYLVSAGINNGTSNDLYLSFSMDNGITWHNSGAFMEIFGEGDPESHWDRANLYRSSLVWRATGHGIVADLYYSASQAASGTNWHTGKTTITFDPRYDRSRVDLSYLIAGSVNLIGGIETTFPFYDGDTLWLARDSSKEASKDSRLEFQGKADGKFWVDTLYIQYRNTNGTAGDNKIDSVFLYGPKTNSAIADSIYYSSATEYTSASPALISIYIGEEFDSGEQIKLRIVTTYGVADRTTRILDAWLQGWEICCESPF